MAFAVEISSAIGDQIVIPVTGGGDLSRVVDGFGGIQNDVGIGGDERIQIAHAVLRSPQECPHPQAAARAAHYPDGGVDAEGFAVGSTREHAEITSSSRVPRNGVGGAAGVS